MESGRVPTCWFLLLGRAGPVVLQFGPTLAISREERTTSSSSRMTQPTTVVPRGARRPSAGTRVVRRLRLMRGAPSADARDSRQFRSGDRKACGRSHPTSVENSGPAGSLQPPLPGGSLGSPALTAGPGLSHSAESDSSSRSRFGRASRIRSFPSMTTALQRTSKSGSAALRVKSCTILRPPSPPPSRVPAP